MAVRNVTEKTNAPAGLSPLAPRLLNEQQAADFLGLSVKTLRRWRWARQGVAWFKVGSAVRYSPDDLHAFVAAGRQETDPSD